jgi:hypothetical protein
MPDLTGKQKGPGTKSPDQAYKDGRAEDVQEGSLGADTGGKDVQKSRFDLGADGDEKGTAQVGGFAGQEVDDSPDAGRVDQNLGGEGDPSPHAQYDSPKKDDAAAAGQGDSGPMSVGEGAKDLAPGSLGNDGPDEVGQRGYAQQPDYDATDPEAKQPHPRTPSDMGNR